MSLLFYFIFFLFNFFFSLVLMEINFTNFVMNKAKQIYITYKNLLKGSTLLIMKAKEENNNFFGGFAVPSWVENK